MMNMSASTQLSPSPVPLDVRQSNLDRCGREIAEMEGRHDSPAWLVTLGVEDWKREMEMLTVEKSQSDRGGVPTEANL